jgi:hypothetical protein
VRSLRKPTIAAWAVNQLTRSDRKRVEELVEAGRALRKLEAKLLEGRAGAEDLRTAADRERKLTEDLVAEAGELLREQEGEARAGVLDRVSETLQAAALEPELETEILRGTLTREQRAAGVGALAGEPPTEKRRKRAPAKKRSAEARRAERTASRRVERAETARERAAGRLEQAREAMRERESELAEAEDELRDATAALEKAKRQD